VNESPTQLQMVWPEHLLNVPPAEYLSPMYTLRIYRRGDESRFYEIMELAGWSGWNDEKLRPWLARILPGGWFMAVSKEGGEIVASCMALRSDEYPDGGELGWLACEPAHAGKGLGMVVSAAVTARFIAQGCRKIHLYTEDYRLAAIKTYLKLGYVPFLYPSEMLDRWRDICTQLNWPYTPEEWMA